MTDTAKLHKDYLQTRHFGSLDGLRFISIFAVLWHHAPLWVDMAVAPTIVTRGFLGVPLFFVLSGFLITTLFLREEDSAGRISLMGFYWRRILRILPAYFLVVTAVAVYYIGIKGETDYLGILPYYYLFLSNFLPSDIPLLSPTWSLAVEEQYYVVWPLLLLLLPRRIILPVLGVLILVNFLAVIGALALFGIHAFDLGPLRIEMFTTTYIPILIGSGLAILLHNSKGFEALYGLVGFGGAPIIWFGVLLILMQSLPFALPGWPNLALHTAMGLFLASLVVRENHVLRPVLSTYPIARIGQISYGIYLYHLIGLHIANAILPDLGVYMGWAVLVVYSLITIIGSEISFRYYETPFLKMRNRVSS